MRTRTLRAPALLAAAALSLGTVAGARQPDGTTAAAALARLDASDIDGRRWSLAELRGRVVLLDFWATWCAPCLAEIPRLQRLRGAYSRRDFEIVGISLDATSRRSLTSFLNRNRIDWPQIHQSRGYGSDLARLFRVEQLPVTILLRRDGSVEAIDLRGEALTARVHELVSSSRGSSEPVR